MNPHRKLLVLGLNELLNRKLVSLDGADEPESHLITEIAGYPSVIIWNGISAEEMRMSVWWKYDHHKHPQADLQGNSRETFTGYQPLARPTLYSKFVGVTASAWLERRTGKFLQGKGREGIFEIYTRTGEKAALDALATPVPIGYGSEGKFFP